MVRLTNLPAPHAPYAGTPPRWAFEEVERERCMYLGAEPNPANIDIWMGDPIGWATYHAWAASIERRYAAKRPPDTAPAPLDQGYLRPGAR